jgi:hypothetical protein
MIYWPYDGFSRVCIIYSEQPLHQIEIARTARRYLNIYSKWNRAAPAMRKKEQKSMFYDNTVSRNLVSSRRRNIQKRQESAAWTEKLSISLSLNQRNTSQPFRFRNLLHSHSAGIHFSVVFLQPNHRANQFTILHLRTTGSNSSLSCSSISESSH